MTDDGIRTGTGPTPLVRSPAEPGRLSTLAIAAGAANVIPLPWVPGVARKRIRGAVAHDVAARRGISLTPAARDALADGSLDARGKVAFTAVGAVTWFARRAVGRLGLLGAVPTVTAGIETWALGLLFDRYLERVRASRTVRIDEHEARRVRAAIDRAVVRALSPDVRQESPPPRSEAPEEMRDGVTQVLDRVLLGVAALPAWVERRLYAAFDEVAREAELGRA